MVFMVIRPWRHPRCLLLWEAWCETLCWAKVLQMSRDRTVGQLQVVHLRIHGKHILQHARKAIIQEPTEVWWYWRDIAMSTHPATKVCRCLFSVLLLSTFSVPACVFCRAPIT